MGQQTLKTVLHVGCGPKQNRLPREYSAHREFRLDLDPGVDPDVVSSIVAMPMVETGSVDCVFASHVLEHLYHHEAAMALAEFLRVLAPGGTADIRVPDLCAIGGRIGLDQLGDALYQNPAFGTVTPLDMLYGSRREIAAGNLFMAHKTGFTQSVLKRALAAAGFARVEFDTKTQMFELRALATKRSDSIFGVGGAAEGLANAAEVKEVNAVGSI